MFGCYHEDELDAIQKEEYDPQLEGVELRSIDEREDDNTHPQYVRPTLFMSDDEAEAFHAKEAKKAAKKAEEKAKRASEEMSTVNWDSGWSDY